MKIKNSRKKAKKILSVVLIICWVCLIGYTGVYVYNNFLHPKKNQQKIPGGSTLTHQVDETEVTEEKKNSYKVPNPLFPRFLSIPNLKISNARVVQLGLIKNTNQLDSPISIHDAGWYMKSALPGNSKGALLIDGHNGGPTKGGIFENLGNLSKGSDIIVERGDGQKITYEVKDVREMTVDEINDENNKFGMSTMLDSFEPSKEGLNIITCVGDWDYSKNTFNKRVMLRAVRKS